MRHRIHLALWLYFCSYICRLPYGLSLHGIYVSCVCLYILGCDSGKGRGWAIGVCASAVVRSMWWLGSDVIGVINFGAIFMWRPTHGFHLHQKTGACLLTYNFHVNTHSTFCCRVNWIRTGLSSTGFFNKKIHLSVYFIIYKLLDTVDIVVNCSNFFHIQAVADYNLWLYGQYYLQAPQNVIFYNNRFLKDNKNNR